jgi:hypothetical protein
MCLLNIHDGRILLAGHNLVAVLDLHNRLETRRRFRRIIRHSELISWDQTLGYVGVVVRHAAINIGAFVGVVYIVNRAALLQLVRFVCVCYFE